MKTALVLSGGGARGAYEAGVILYLREGLPQALGRPAAELRLDIISGTSIGAINACYLASRAHEPDRQAAGLADLWRSLRLEDVFRWSTLGLSALPAWIYRELRAIKTRHLSWRISDFLYPEALARVVNERIDWAQLERNVETGRLEAVTVTATDLSTGRAVVFVQSRNRLPPWSRDPLVEARPARLGPEHALASGAIPLLFRPVLIDGTWFSDGSIRLNTPLSPAIRLGADRVLIIGLRHEGVRKDPVTVGSAAGEVPGTAAQLGRMLNALHLDRTDYDLDRLRKINRLIEQGEKAFGAGFEERFNAVSTRAMGAPLRRVRDLVIRPSRDIGLIAGRHAEASARRARPGTLASRLLRRAAVDADASADGAADLASYLLFDRGYAEELLALGYADAEARRDALAEFFGGGG